MSGTFLANETAPNINRTTRFAFNTALQTGSVEKGWVDHALSLGIVNVDKVGEFSQFGGGLEVRYVEVKSAYTLRAYPLGKQSGRLLTPYIGIGGGRYRLDTITKGLGDQVYENCPPAVGNMRYNCYLISETRQRIARGFYAHGAAGVLVGRGSRTKLVVEGRYEGYKKDTILNGLNIWMGLRFFSDFW